MYCYKAWTYLSLPYLHVADLALLYTSSLLRFIYDMLDSFFTNTWKLTTKLAWFKPVQNYKYKINSTKYKYKTVQRFLKF